MERSKLGHREWARYARQSLEEIAAACEVEVFHAHGPGGQGVNTSDSAVRMRHIPTGLVVTSRESRSQLQNRKRCAEKLKAEFAKRSVPKKKRVPTRPTKGSVERRLGEKKARSQLKSLRGRISRDD